jgi:hypothetical protein
MNNKNQLIEMEVLAKVLAKFKSIKIIKLKRNDKKSIKMNNEIN